MSIQFNLIKEKLVLGANESSIQEFVVALAPFGPAAGAHDAGRRGGRDALGRADHDDAQSLSAAG